MVAGQATKTAPVAVDTEQTRHAELTRRLATLASDEMERRVNGIGSPVRAADYLAEKAKGGPTGTGRRQRTVSLSNDHASGAMDRQFMSRMTEAEWDANDRDRDTRYRLDKAWTPWASSPE